LNILKEVSDYLFADPSMVHGWNDEELNTLKTISGTTSKLYGWVR